FPVTPPTQCAHMSIIDKSRALMFTIFIVGCASAYAEKWSQAQIRQIEEIAQEIARQTNANKSNLIDNVTAGVNATAKGRSVTFEYLVRTKRDLPGSEIQEWIAAARAETIPNICRLNSN